MLDVQGRDAEMILVMQMALPFSLGSRLPGEGPDSSQRPASPLHPPLEFAGRCLCLDRQCGLQEWTLGEQP